MEFEKDSRRRDKFDASKKHFRGNKHQPKTKRDKSGPRTRPAEDQSHSGSRGLNKQLSLETLKIIENGHYEIDEQVVDISQELFKAIKETITYPPDTPVSCSEKSLDTKFQVELETTLSGCYRETRGCERVTALNFASAKNPGGGFLKGSSAQEESLTRSSGLYACIKDSKMYDINTEDNNKCLYSHWMIYSPNVPVFRDDDDELLTKPYLVSFINAPAVNTGVALRKGVSLEMIKTVMAERIDRVLAIAAYHQTETLVLGSWGCGVFGGDIRILGKLFYDSLTGKYAGLFSKILFSTLSKSDYDTLCEIYRAYC